MYDLGKAPQLGRFSYVIICMMIIEVKIRKDVELGTWQGIGGAITEATAYNYAKLNPSKKRQLLDAYFSKHGLDYRWGRLSIGGNDFCLKPYEYTKRVDLSDFSIKHDEKWVLPMLGDILRKKNLCLVATPWSPPKCMKFTLGNFSVLKPWCYDEYAKYIRRWLEEYAKKGVKINYLTPQNEPRAAQIWESCVYSYRAQKKFAYRYLAEELKDFDTKILLWDHNKRNLTRIAGKLFSGKYVTEFGRDKKIAGLCYHWYNGSFPDEMWQVRQKYPDIMLLSSEMCCGFSPYDESEWREDAKLYLRELFADINTGASAWIDWNMFLSWQGGPSYCKNYVKSPVILNETEDDFILTPIYYALKKVAELFPADSKVVRCEYKSDDVVAIARKTKSGCKVVVANIANREQKVRIKLGKRSAEVVLKESDIFSVHI